MSSHVMTQPEWKHPFSQYSERMYAATTDSPLKRKRENPMVMPSVMYKEAAIEKYVPVSEETPTNVCSPVAKMQSSTTRLDRISPLQRGAREECNAPVSNLFQQSSSSPNPLKNDVPTVKRMRLSSSGQTIKLPALKTRQRMGDSVGSPNGNGVFPTSDARFYIPPLKHQEGALDFGLIQFLHQQDSNKVQLPPLRREQGKSPTEPLDLLSTASGALPHLTTTLEQLAKTRSSNSSPSMHFSSVQDIPQRRSQNAYILPNPVSLQMPTKASFEAIPSNEGVLRPSTARPGKKTTAKSETSSACSSPSASAKKARGPRLCRFDNCNNVARSRGFCRTHGGGKRCAYPNCNKSAQANRKCIAHGGGTPCSFEGCSKTAQSRGLCKAHGGGARCRYPNCPKSSQSKGLCRGHGGGIKCKEEGCEKWVQKSGYCIKHGRERCLV